MHPLEKRILLPQDLKPLNSLAEYKAQGGLLGLEKARGMTPKELIAEVKKANLRGRGGAGFPMAIKWETVSSAPDSKKYVVCNFAEGEPGTYKDRYLISKNPYLVLEGMLISAHAIGATQAIICTKEKFKKIVPRLQGALKEFEDAGIAPKGFLKLVLGPDNYLLGEEKGLLEVIDGRTPMPRLFPPFLVGVYWTPTETNPTVVNNAESMSHLPHILSKGADWFRSTGTADTPGTVIFSLSGDVKKPGMYEVPTGLTVRQLLYELGGGPAGNKPIRAVFSGVANRVMTPDQFDLKIDFGTLRAAGVGLGSAGFMVYDESRCMVEAAWMFAKFLAVSSCGQCVPCNMGTRVIAGHLYNLQFEKASTEDIDAIMAEAGRCTSQTRCFLPTQTSVLITSLIKKFPEEFQYHARHGCTYTTRLSIPKIESFDEETGQFTMEANPIEFREAPAKIL
jgi:NADH:ubiquinone oxidoreductase subunit F (NADH-binding)